MKEKFVSLTLKEDNKKCLISSVMITSIIEEDHFRSIRTMGGELYHVKESTNEILDLINKSELYKFVNK